SFTIHDREDSADLLNLVRHDLGFSNTERRFPAKGTCLSIYLRVVNAESPLENVLASLFPWCATWEFQLLDARLELHRPHYAHLKAEVAQRGTQVAVDGEGPPLHCVPSGRQ